jgi:4'-phosphopantetheinyl transferase
VPGPRRPPLTAAALHVWHVDLAAADASLAQLLTPAERERAARIVRPRQRELWARGRGALRALLGRYLQSDPQALVLLAGEHGKPALAGDELQFNLSHSGGSALYAFTPQTPVGVDLELRQDPARRARTDYCALAARALGSPAAERLRALDPARREAEFMRLWTRREAALKQRGVGIGGSGASGPIPAWEAELDVGTDAVAAVAAARAPEELCLWRWEGLAGG